LEDLLEWLAIDSRQRRNDLLGRKRRHGVLQLRQLVGDVGWQKIAPRRKHLAELDEDRTEILERLSKTHGTRRRKIAPEKKRIDERPQGSRALMAQRKLVQAVPQRDHDDAGKARDAHARDCTGGSVRRPRYNTKRRRRLRGLAGPFTDDT